MGTSAVDTLELVSNRRRWASLPLAATQQPSGEKAAEVMGASVLKVWTCGDTAVVKVATVVVTVAVTAPMEVGKLF